MRWRFVSKDNGFVLGMLRLMNERRLCGGRGRSIERRCQLLQPFDVDSALILTLFIVSTRPLHHKRPAPPQPRPTTFSKNHACPVLSPGHSTPQHKTPPTRPHSPCTIDLQSDRSHPTPPLQRSSRPGPRGGTTRLGVPQPLPFLFASEGVRATVEMRNGRPAWGRMSVFET